jgi:protein-L-isoaspartate(D-aspartate) O-methyltransferase
MVNQPGHQIRLCLTIALMLVLLPLILLAQDYQKLRETMVNEQLVKRGIKSNTVLESMRTVERHRFVPLSQIMNAYSDAPLPIGYGQTISQPYIVAFMTETLDLKPTDNVLEIGTGSGYQAAILSRICNQVYTIEIVPQLGRQADSLLNALHYSNVAVRIGDGYQGWPEAAPFDAIIVTCSPDHIPKPLQDQLKEGGRLIIPVGDRYVQELVLATKIKGKLKAQNKLPVLFVPMRDKKGLRY